MLIKFTKHALERMKVRSITKEEILDAINNFKFREIWISRIIIYIRIIFA